ncbi:type II and III secretion system protein family protein [Sphingomonas radiodurans]|uniref:type II and III secretion system protein family protein n=1 Tax=Sphingomonas radiodurans TaxID=2890321 RepID=UPI001E3DC3C1|nr:type II and III secretion system protein family protein [Sphingomonas radiodurans]WBH16772.1 type II and III secretion system protein family protein [Sphingomonas radiodurans]
MGIRSKPIGWPLAVALAAAGTLGVSAAAPAQNAGARNSAAQGPMLQIATSRGRLITLAKPMSDLFVANPDIADVQVRSPTQLYVFGKKAGETTISATAKNGAVVYSATVRVGNNFDSLGQMLAMAMPDASVTATTMNGVVLLTGTVASPDDGAEAERLVQAFVGQETKVVSRMRTATPLQVNLQVRFAEVSRTFVKNISSNILTRDTTGGFQFGVASGRAPGTIGNFPTTGLPVLDASSRFGLPAGSISLPFDVKTGNFVYPNSGSSYEFTKGAERTSLGLAGKILGLDVLQALDLGERIGQVTSLANPNLTALSGETGTFLAGGEIPIPIAQGLGGIGVEYKQFGVSIAYTPTVLSDGRISLRVRPEVSQLDYSNAVTIGGAQVPGLTTRRTETTVELGSGQSFMIAGLLQNNHNNSIEKTPGIGDVPILGALFRSNGFTRNETELVIVITPYLVKPVNANEIVLPTDGYESPSDVERVLLGKLGGGKSGESRPKPRMEAGPPAAPAMGAVAPIAPVPLPDSVAPVADAKASRGKGKKGGDVPAPGFSVN